VISAPVHVEDFPARYAPQMGAEGANVLFDTWVHPLVMGLEEHLLGMFREDFEFSDDAGPSHLGGHRPAPQSQPRPQTAPQPAHAEPVMDEAEPSAPATAGEPVWSDDAMAELKKIPFFVRGKARRNTETYAAQNGAQTITVDTLYDAKAHFGR